MTATSIIVIAILSILIITCGIAYLMERKHRNNEAKLFARDHIAISEQMFKYDITYEEAKKRHLKWCKNHGIKTFCTYKPIPEKKGKRVYSGGLRPMNDVGGKGNTEQIIPSSELPVKATKEERTCKTCTFEPSRRSKIADRNICIMCDNYENWQQFESVKEQTDDTKDFLKYVDDAKRSWVNKAFLTLRKKMTISEITEMESLFICFDQMKERIIARKPKGMAEWTDEPIKKTKIPNVLCKYYHYQRCHCKDVKSIYCKYVGQKNCKNYSA